MNLKGLFKLGSKPAPSPPPPPFPLRKRGRWLRVKARLGRLFGKATVFTSAQPPLPPFPQSCPNCENPVALNTATGEYFDYCSKACARRPGPSQRGVQAPSLCERCKRRPKFRKGTKVYPHCGLTCARLAADNTLAPTNPTTTLPILRKPPLQPPPQMIDEIELPPLPEVAEVVPSSDSTCRTPGCTSPVFVRRDGTLSNYCMMLHREWGERGCISCRAAPMISTSVLCQPCHDRALSMAPMILEVPEDHRNYKSAEKQFKRTWRHNTTCPEVKAIYKIIVSEASLRQYQKYLDSVEDRGNFAATGKPRGNESRRWHGTKRKCNLGDPGNTTFCADSGCSLCCIIKMSFDVKFFKAATGWGRFGHGIYTSSTSSKSNDYSKNVDIDSDWKALLLNKVVIGNGKTMTQNSTSLTGPPSGYDSIVAKPDPGGSLNYDELVVYKNEAVRPSYLVMYQSP